MLDKELDFSLDDILAEFGDEAKPLAPPSASVPAQTHEEAESRPATRDDLRPIVREEAAQELQPRRREAAAEELPRRRREAGAEELPRRRREPSAEELPRRRRETDAEERPRRRREPSAEEPPRRRREADAEERPRRRRSPAEPESGRSQSPRRKKESFFTRLGFGLVSLIFAGISILGLLWALVNLHPDSSVTMAESGRSATNVDVVSRLSRSLEEAKAGAFGAVLPPEEVAALTAHYVIPEDQLVAPAPDSAKFGTVKNEQSAELLNVIQQARDSGLLEDQDVIFDPNADFYYGADIEYYLDDSILVICWKEVIDGNTVSCCEVKVADASQFRRKFAGDTFGSSLQFYATDLARSVNAVVAMNADFYQFRDFGIVAFQRDLCRFDTSTYTGMYKKYNCVDTLFVDQDGDFHFFHRLEEADWASMQQWMNENNIIFSIAFGPVLVENGELQYCDWYPAGEIDSGYSRASISQFDHLHYFYMSLNHSNEKQARWTVNEFAQHVYEKGVYNAYCLDGGQTSEIVFQDRPYNYIDWGAERLVSDIIYFATAIPEGGGTE